MLWDEHGALATTLILSQCVCCIGRGASMQASGARHYMARYFCIAPQLVTTIRHVARGLHVLALLVHLACRALVYLRGPRGGRQQTAHVRMHLRNSPGPDHLARFRMPSIQRRPRKLMSCCDVFICIAHCQPVGAGNFTAMAERPSINVVVVGIATPGPIA